MRVGRWLTIAVLALALAGAAGTPVAAAAKTETQPAEEKIWVVLQHQVHGHDFDGRHVLQLLVYPLRGVAVVSTESNNFDIENREVVTYAEQIPKGPFDGYLDLHFKGLGSFVGEFVATESDREGHLPKGCEGRRATFAVGSLEGAITFRGAGGYAHWSASRAEAGLSRSSPLRCRAGTAERVRKPKALLDYTQIGPAFFSGWRYQLRARRRAAHRVVYFDVATFERKSALVADFAAGVYEYLPSGIAVSRAVDRRVRRGSRFEVSHGGYHPEQAALRPPPPFSGVGHYSHGSHRLTGTLAVRFPGLRLRIGGRRTVASLVDERALPEKSPKEHFYEAPAPGRAR